MSVLATCLALHLRAEPATMSILHAGTSVGQCRFERTADGAFHSSVQFKIGRNQTESSIDGLEDDGRIVRFKAIVDDSAGPIVYTYANERLVARRGKRVDEFDFTLPVSTVAKLHPQITGRLLNTLKGNGPWRSACWVVDANVESPLQVAAPSTVSLNGEMVRRFHVSFNSVEVEYDLNGAGDVVAMDLPADHLRFVTPGWEGLFDPRASAGPPLSPPAFRTERVRNLRLRMRDGVTLVADAVRPSARGRYPVILERTSNGRSAAIASGDFWAKRGYVYVVQDCRGRGDSGGAWTPFVNEGRDGVDTINGLTRQPWSNGSVGMVGEEYAGTAAWLAAVEAPRSLRGIAPDRAAFGDRDLSPRSIQATIPVLHMTDPDSSGTMLPWEAMRRAGRRDQWLVIEPPGEATHDPMLNELRLRFFDTCLKGLEGGMEAVPRVQAFVTGANRWITLDGWPSSASSFETLYLAPSGLISGPGTAGVSVYVYDPSRDKNRSGWLRLPSRGAYALFKSAPFPKATAIGGPFECRLFFKTGARETDLFARLLDLSPDGSIQPIGEPGTFRASSLGSTFAPGRIVSALLRPTDAAHELATGHRLGLLIDSLKSSASREVQRNVIMTGTVTPSRITFRRLW